MPDPRLPRTAFSGGFGAPDAVSEPELHDRCVRCGRPTPLGVSMCEADNPGAIGAPSATQLHGTIAAGVGIGLLLVALLARFMLAGVGPFGASLSGQALRSDGGVDVVVTVTNQGSKSAPATCHVQRTGFARPDDFVFLTPSVDAGATATFARTVPPPADPGDGPYVEGQLTVTCR